jgi:hypothetical protein
MSSLFNCTCSSGFFASDLRLSSSRKIENVYRANEKEKKEKKKRKEDAANPVRHDYRGEDVARQGGLRSSLGAGVGGAKGEQGGGECGHGAQQHTPRGTRANGTRVRMSEI